MKITDEMVEAATRAIHDMDCDTPECAGQLTIEGRYGRWARKAVEAVVPLVAAQAAEETEEEWSMRYRLNGDEKEPGYGGHVFDSREEAQRHIEAWRQHYPNLSYTDVRFVRRTVSWSPWEDAGTEVGGTPETTNG